MTESTHVVIAEDDNDDFEMFTFAIEDLAISVIIRRADNGIGLMTLLEEQIPDILFLDTIMPLKDGLQCLKEIRANKKFDLLPVIMYSSYHDPSSIEFCFREGANLYLMKAASFSQLKEVLSKVFSIEWKKNMYYPPLNQFVVNPAQ